MTLSRASVIVMLVAPLLSGQSKLHVLSSRRVPWYDYSATLSPDGKSVLYTNREGVQILDLETGATRQILPVGQGTSNWAFAPDGKSVFYTRAGEQQTWVREADSLSFPKSEPRKLLTGICCMVLSPDGQYLAYFRNTQGYTPGSLFVSRADGTGERKVAEVQRVNLHAWSADGQSLLLSRWDRGTTHELTLISVRNGRSTPLVSAKEYMQSPKWPPGAGGIYMLRPAYDRHQLASQIWHYSLPDGVWTEATNEPDGFIVLLSATSDGSMLAALRRLDLGTFWDGMMDMFGVPNGNPNRYQTELVLLKK